MEGEEGSQVEEGDEVDKRQRKVRSNNDLMWF